MLFRKKIERCCAYCQFGGKADEDTIVCAKKGLRAPDSKCRKFRYDPIKRIPPKAKALDFSKYDGQDFSL
jgi:hypothetical protein